MEGTSAKILLRQDYKKIDGRHFVYLQIIINRTPCKISLKNVSVKPIYWDEKNGRVKKGDPEHLKKNLIIESALKRANEILFDYKVNFKSLDTKQFKNEFNPPPKVKSLSFIEYAEKDYIEPMYRCNGSSETYRTRKSFLNKVKIFAKGDLLFEDITLDFIERFKESMIVNDKNSINSVARILKTMKAVINKAKVNGLVKENVFDKIRIPTKEGTRESLTDDEVSSLNALLNKPDTPKTYIRALKPFLFCCYTGLRFRDISNLRFKHIIKINENRHTKWYLKFVAHKGQKPRMIPLSENAIELMPDRTFDEGRVFSVYTNQPQNKYVHAACTSVGITKNICFHSSRHTFGMTLHDSGTQMGTIKNLMGHSSVQTTEIYAKSSQKADEKAIENLDNLFKSAYKKRLEKKTSYSETDQ